MSCMKCGRESEDGQAFCPQCLKLAEQCPVKQDVVIQLPQRQVSVPRKAAPRKRPRTPEEQILHLKRVNRRLICLVSLLLAATILLAGLSIDFLRQLDVQQFLGQNYSTAETTD